MLIAADYYWIVVLVERLTKFLVALGSIFGWAEQGPIPLSRVCNMHANLFKRRCTDLETVVCLLGSRDFGHTEQDSWKSR